MARRGSGARPDSTPRIQGGGKAGERSDSWDPEREAASRLVSCEDAPVVVRGRAKGVGGIGELGPELLCGWTGGKSPELRPALAVALPPLTPAPARMRRSVSAMGALLLPMPLPAMLGPKLPRRPGSGVLLPWPLDVAGKALEEVPEVWRREGEAEWLSFGGRAGSPAGIARSCSSGEPGRPFRKLERMICASRLEAEAMVSGSSSTVAAWKAAHGP